MTTKQPSSSAISQPSTANSKANSNAPLVSQSAPSSSSSTTVTHSPSEVAWMFVREYYHYLNSEPSRLHLFYGKDSTALHGLEGNHVDPATGQSDIQKFIATHNFKDVRVVISNVDSQRSANDGVIIQVLGELSNNSKPSQKFVQTFFLAKQPTGYFVLNDILRYLCEEVDEDDNQPPAYSLEPSTASSTTTTETTTTTTTVASVSTNTNINNESTVSSKSRESSPSSVSKSLSNNKSKAKSRQASPTSVIPVKLKDDDKSTGSQVNPISPAPTESSNVPKPNSSRPVSPTVNKGKKPSTSTPTSKEGPVTATTITPTTATNTATTTTTTNNYHTNTNNNQSTRSKSPQEVSQTQPAQAIKSSAPISSQPAKQVKPTTWANLAASAPRVPSAPNTVPTVSAPSTTIATGTNNTPTATSTPPAHANTHVSPGKVGGTGNEVSAYGHSKVTVVGVAGQELPSRYPGFFNDADKSVWIKLIHFQESVPVEVFLKEIPAAEYQISSIIFNKAGAVMNLATIEQARQLVGRKINHKGREIVIEPRKTPQGPGSNGGMGRRPHSGGSGYHHHRGGHNQSNNNNNDNFVPARGSRGRGGSGRGGMSRN